MFFDENVCGNVTQCVVRRVREGTAERGRAGAQKTRPVAGGETPEPTPPRPRQTLLGSPDTSVSRLDHKHAPELRFAKRLQKINRASVWAFTQQATKRLFGN